MRRSIIAAILLATSPLALTAPAQAQFFGGGIVYDPTNHTQNLLMAARSLEQIRNQIRQLQNEAEMLRNQAEDLLALDIDVSAELRRIMEEIFRLTEEANAISYKVEETDRVFREHYPEEYKDWSETQMAETAEFQWQTSRAAYQDTLIMQSRIVQAIKVDTRVLDDLVSASQDASGNLAVQQAGNQLTALGIKQDMQLQQLMAAQYRAEALERARRLQIERESMARHSKFMSGAASAYKGH
ncbi:P-type conjugative transfer protein TrbJ [Hyphomonas sp.]|uniref:P-type conjugative transfer protein TrbJ n=1 Tax=Hyphomonas sp. TaxID=87 RepID=UPI0025BD564B|nr:P-type conjugative transfer protein TrbJ [Hyphomonas sp.]